MIGKVFQFLLLSMCLICSVSVAWSQEAAQSFEHQNGFLPQKQFEQALAAFKEVETPEKGLGIHFNESSCAACHGAGRGGGLPGGSGPITELRAGHLGTNNEFIPAPGGTLITTKALGGATPEEKALSSTQNVRDRFITPSLFGLGYVESLSDETLRKIAREEANNSDGRIRGLIREVPVLEAKGKMAVGRFGWAAQHSSLLSLSADAYRNEIGITSPLEPNDNTLLGDPVDDGVRDPEDSGEPFGEDVALFADFVRALSAPPRLLPSAQRDRREIEEGFKIFKNIGCISCHAAELVTANEGEYVNARTFRVPKALGNKKFHPYGDFLLHDIGTGPTIVREGLSEASKGWIRTAALWGVGTRQVNGEPFLHDGSAHTLEEAIQRHKNSAAREAENYQRLRQFEKTRILKFLGSL